MRYINFLLSTRVTLVLLISFAAAMAAATFIENDYGTPVARALVYEAWWFEMIMVWLAINFVAHIGHYKLFHKNRWPIGMFHLAFVFIILGAGVTRYFGREGTIHIREGKAESIFYTHNRYLQLKQLSVTSSKRFEKPITLISHNFKPQSTTILFNEPLFKVIFQEYITGGKEQIIKGNQTYFDLAVALGNGREDHLIRRGDSLLMGNISLGTLKESSNPIKVFKIDNAWMIRSDIHMQIMEMSTQKISVLHAREIKPLQLRSLYQWEGGAFMVKAIHSNSALVYRSEPDKKLAKNLPDWVKLKITDLQDNLITERYIKLVSFAPTWYPFTYKNQAYTVTYGPRAEMLPFSLYLKKFDLERYPGSQSPASYASELTVKDAEKEFPYRVFMNNVLDHKGYRFYQSSFDTDEKGTVLSVNQDRPGSNLTYLGYFLMGLGMFLTLFTKGSRFQLLNKKLGSIRKKELAIPATAAMLILCLTARAETPTVSTIVPNDKAAVYGKLVIQDLDGRMKPLNTLANEIVRKLNGRSSIWIPTKSGQVELSAEQFLLAVQMDPITFSQLPIIKIDREKSQRVFAALGIQPTDRISFKDFINKDGDYLLHDLVDEANRLKPSERNEAHKELLKTDERFNIFYALLTGDFLRIFPNKNDPNNTWFTSQQSQQGFDEEDARFVANITPLYLDGLKQGVQKGDWKQADEALKYIDLYQQQAGKKVYPEGNLLEAELIYNKLNLGNRLFTPFWLLGIFMLVSGITLLFRETKLVQWVWNVGKVMSWLGFAIFTAHLGLRWFIAQRPPWTDGFEMLVFVAWGILFFGLLFSGKSKFTIPLSLLFSGTLLFVGFLDWLNPEITNLMPVLHSYWLKIHVAIIVSSYAPLALAAILALLNLLFITFKPASPNANWWINMKELTIVNELATTIGLFLLAIGTFLGGVWANESWGRYWAWDPKETWALISVMVYAFVLHLRLIPTFNNSLVYNLTNLWAFSSIIMTSFGVNYYLSGLHSYAAGDPVPIPHWVYWATGILLLISVLSILKYRKLNDQEKSALVV
ncbi:cytochrome C biogenesis protein [Solitalea longa]|uniref:Cytochrome C biogenesis protein n=1 Tax=Solitalea longa TaxID=2079460 RepID=A0A2S4ZX75_9SPHI|nr:cytochrome c biogenesis protein CcsA [Solitalea longa]POY34886.1 cytochrome C biogenesis protein [Solitalea longa]